MDRCLAAPRDHKRWATGMGRRGVDPEAVEREVASVVDNRLPRPEASQQVDALVGARPTLAGRHADGREVRLVLAADTDPENHASTRSVVQIGYLLGEERGRIEREQEGGGANRRGAGLLDEPGQPDHRFRRRIDRGDMAPHPKGAHSLVLEAPDHRSVGRGDEAEDG